MTPIYAEISAAPHLPPALRVQFEGGVNNSFSRHAANDVIEDNGELILVSHPVTGD